MSHMTWILAIFFYSLIWNILDSELSSLFMISQVNIIHDKNSYVQGESEKDAQVEGKIEWVYRWLLNVQVTNVNLFAGVDCKIVVSKSKHSKCPRCWNYHSLENDSLCARCSNVLLL